MKDSIKTKRNESNTKITSIRPLHQAPTKHLDKKTLDHIRNIVFEQLKQYDLYQDDAGVIDHYQQLLYAVEALYTYIYTKKKSNLTKEDAKIFVSYVSDRIKKLKEIIEHTK